MYLNTSIFLSRVKFTVSAPVLTVPNPKFNTVTPRPVNSDAVVKRFPMVSVTGPSNSIYDRPAHNNINPTVRRNDLKSILHIYIYINYINFIF